MKSTNDIQLRGEDVVCALREWTKEEIKGAASRAYDLGKFFVGVSAASIAIITSGLKDGSRLGPFHLCSLTLLAISMFIAVWMVLPRLSKIQADQDLLLAFTEDMKTVVAQVWIWFALWLASFAVLFFTLSTSRQ